MKIVAEQRIHFIVFVSVWFPSFSLSYYWVYSSFIDAVQYECVCAIWLYLTTAAASTAIKYSTTYKFDSTNLQLATCCVRIKLFVCSCTSWQITFFLQFTVKRGAIKSYNCDHNFDLYKWEKRAVSNFYANWILCAQILSINCVLTKNKKIQFSLFFFSNFDWIKRFKKNRSKDVQVQWWKWWHGKSYSNN